MGRIGLDVYAKDPRVIYAVIETDLTGQRVAGQEDQGRAFLGVRGHNHPSGFELIAILEDRPAAKAGLQAGDILVRIGERPITGFTALIAALRENKPDDESEIAVLRDGQEVVVTLRFGTSSRGPSFNRGSQGGQTANVQERQGGQGIETGGLFRTDDGGDTWVRVNSLNPRPFYYSQVRVDPSSDERVFILGISLHRSKDGGKTFEGRAGRGTHPDHHALWIDPDDPDHILLGNDGGLYITHDGCQTWNFIDVLPLGQFYNVAVDMRNPYRVYGGLQDNGCWAGPSRSRRSDGTAPGDWVQINGGDGFHCAADPTDPDSVYCESQHGAMVRRNLKTGEMRMVDRPRRDIRFNWNTPFLLSPHNPFTLYFAGNKVFRSVDQGVTSVAVSPEISRTDQGSATSLVESPREAGTLYVGTDDGALWATMDGGQHWEDLSPALPELDQARYVSDIEASRHLRDRVYVTLDGHRSNDYGAYVFRSDDHGETWDSLSSNLPQVPVRCLAEDLENPELLFVGTEFGCFVTLDGGITWTPFKSKLPSVAVHDLVIHPRDDDLVAGTHGRGIWIVNMAPLRELDEDTLASAFHLFEVGPAYLWNRTSGTHPYGAQRFRAEEAPEGAVIHYRLGADLEEEVELNITDVLGRTVRTLQGPGETGFHRVVWNLRGGRDRAGPRRSGRRGGGDGAGPRGTSRVEAGEYVVSITVERETQSRRIRVLPDPDTALPQETTGQLR
jgi:photosystem II stability/assembly factor-like uncharacterized protein